MLSRRRVLMGLAVALPVAAVAGRRYFTPQFDGDVLSLTEAHAMAVAGEIYLIDIRRPDEWSATGSGEGAVRIDMRAEDFEAQLLAVAGDRDAPIALICAAGVRSARLSARLSAAGFSRIIDVPEGMTGGRYGPGWINTGLPVVSDAEYGA